MDDRENNPEDPDNSRWDNFEVYRDDENDSLPPLVAFLVNLIAPLLGGVVAFFGAAFLWTILVVGSRSSGVLMDSYEVTALVVGGLATLAWFAFYLRHFRTKK